MSSTPVDATAARCLQSEVQPQGGVQRAHGRWRKLSDPLADAPGVHGADLLGLGLGVPWQAPVARDGAKRGTFYTAAPPLRRIAEDVRKNRTALTAETLFTLQA